MKLESHYGLVLLEDLKKFTRVAFDLEENVALSSIAGLQDADFSVMDESMLIEHVQASQEKLRSLEVEMLGCKDHIDLLHLEQVFLAPFSTLTLFNSCSFAPFLSQNSTGRRSTTFSFKFVSASIGVRAK